MLKSTSHRSIQHAKITKKPQYKNPVSYTHLTLPTNSRV